MSGDDQRPPAARPRIFLYEFITGGGCWSFDAALPPQGTLLAEGHVMARAVAEDLLASGDLEVHILADSRLAPLWPADDYPPRCHAFSVNSFEQEQQEFARLAADCEMTLVIAPEFDQFLATRCQWVTQAGGHLLSPALSLVTLTADKPRLADFLKRQGIPHPRCMTLPGGEVPADDFPFPAVLKPIDGAGSQGVRLIPTAADLAAIRPADGTRQLQAYHAGLPVSIAALCGPAQQLVLQPGHQRLSPDGRFRYQGGSWPLPPDLRRRAKRLTAQAISVLPAPHGYLGLDLVLGAAEDGSEDVVIEINPRLTTSYVGLRRLARTNLAGAMLRVAQGLPQTIHWSNQPVDFEVGDASGVHTCTG